MKKHKHAKIHTLLTALDVVRKYCAYQERSQMEVRNKLFELGLNKFEVEQAISQLIEENFLNEERFAITYARGKFRIKNWGKLKIIQGLKLRNITAYCINRAVKEIDHQEYLKTLNRMVEELTEKITEKDQIKKNYIIAKKMTAKGFEPELVWEHIKILNPSA